MEHPENSGEYKGLAVNKGIEQPSSVNPYLKRKPKKRQLSVAEFVEGIVKGDITILSQAVTLVESVKPEHQAVAQEVIEKCLPHSGNSVRIISMTSLFQSISSQFLWQFFAMNDQYNTCYLVRLQGAVIHSSIKSGRAAALSNICSHNNSDF